jgi:predicted Rossmann fold nucleotide-binding protein DprA/Smf involved in DNA uptake
MLALLETPTPLDDLVRKSGKSPGAVSGIVCILEMKGRIIAVGPRTYVKCAGS